jgi:hypothetical protein
VRTGNKVSSSALGGKDNTSTLGGGAVVFEGLLSLVNERRSGRGGDFFPGDVCVGDSFASHRNG